MTRTREDRTDRDDWADPDDRTDEGDRGVPVRDAIVWVAIPVAFAILGGVATGRWAEVTVAVGAYLGIVVLNLAVRMADGIADRVGNALDR